MILRIAAWSLVLFVGTAQAVTGEANRLAELRSRFEFQNLAQQSLEKMGEFQGKRTERSQSESTVLAATLPLPLSYANDGFLRDQVLSQRWFIGLICAVCILSLVVVLRFVRVSPEHTARDIVNASGMTLIVFGTIILVLVVETSEQLTAAIGVLGAMAGYLFGTIQRRE